jgi:hypothetical protein
MRKTTENLTLQCVLTDEEKAKYAMQLAQAKLDKDRFEADKKSYDDQAKADISSCDSAMSKNSVLVSTGKEFRSVKCKIVYDWDKKTKTWYREDNGDEAKNDIISEFEIQEEIEFQKKELDKVKPE